MAGGPQLQALPACEPPPRLQPCAAIRANHCTEGAQGHPEPPFLGVGEVWFASRKEADQTAATPEWKAAMVDAATFMDLDRVVAGWAEEHQIV